MNTTDKPTNTPPSERAPAPAAHDEHDDLPKNLRKPHPVVVILVMVVFIAILGGLLALGYFPHKATEDRARADASEAANESVLVATTRPRPAESAKEVILPCDIRPNQDTLIFPRTAGYLKTQFVDIQDHVKAGQLLAEIDTPEVDAQLLQARAALQQANANVIKAQADLNLNQRSLERLQSVKTEVTPQELDQATTLRDQASAAVDQANANVGAAQADVKRLEVLQGFEKVTAPFDGVITQRTYDIGALLSATAGRPMYQLQSYDTLRVFVNVPQVYSSDIHTGQPAFLTVKNFPDKVFEGTVARTAGSLNGQTRTLPYELDFPNKDGKLLPGMYGEARLAVASPPQALLVPVAAMLFNANGTQVATVTNGVVHFQNITIGRDLGTDYEVLSGVTPQTEIIANPGERLTEGGTVQAVDIPDKKSAATQTAAAKP